MDEKKTLYNWGKSDLTKVEIFTGDERRPPIPTEGSFARIHNEVNTRKRKRKK